MTEEGDNKKDESYKRHDLSTDRHHPPKRPHELFGSTTEYHTTCGSAFFTINCDKNGYPIEAFGIMGKGGSCSSAVLESLGRSLSVSLQSGVDAAVLIHQLRNINCPGGSWHEGQRISRGPSAYAMAMSNAHTRYERMATDREARLASTPSQQHMPPPPPGPDSPLPADDGPAVIEAERAEHAKVVDKLREAREGIGAGGEGTDADGASGGRTVVTDDEEE